MYHIVRPSGSPSAQPSAGHSVAIADFATVTPRKKAEALARLGWQSQQKPALEEAVTHYRDALALLEGLDFRKHWNVVVPVQNNLASALRELGRYREAEGCYVQAINLLENCTGGAEKAQLGSLYTNLASLYHAVGISDAALRMQEKCVSILESLPDLRSADLNGALKTLATLFRKVGNEARAQEIIARAAQVLTLPLISKLPPKKEELTRVVYPVRRRRSE